MPALTAEQHALIGKETAPVAAPYPANEAMAHHWCEMVEDANPVYFDEAYARTTWLHGTFAPPAMLFTWGRPLLWPVTEREGAIDALKLDGCSATIAVNAVQEYFVPIRYGDRITTTNKLAAVSEEKTTRLGTGHFVTTVETYRNQHGQVVGTHTFTLFNYRPAGGDA
jgi:acyl dehydratase